MDLAQTLVGARESLTRYAMSLCRRRADAEDLVQTAFLRALERAARTSPRLWAFPPPRCARGCARRGCTFKSTWKPKARKDDTFMKPLVLKNIAVLDARRLTEEKAQNIRLIRDVAVVLVTRQTASLLHTVPLKDVAKVSVVPGEDENVNVLSVNGSACRKSPPAAAFSAKTRFPCAFGAAGETCKETLRRKASESTAHVAGFGIPFGGLRPSEPPRRFFDSLKARHLAGFHHSTGAMPEEHTIVSSAVIQTASTSSRLSTSARPSSSGSVKSAVESASARPL